MDERKEVDPVEKKCAALYDYPLGNSLNATIDDDCKINDMSMYVNPLSMINSNKSERPDVQEQSSSHYGRLISTI